VYVRIRGLPTSAYRQRAAAQPQLNVYGEVSDTMHQPPGEHVLDRASLDSARALVE
jgi:hypothetical protein